MLYFLAVWQPFAVHYGAGVFVLKVQYIQTAKGCEDIELYIIHYKKCLDDLNPQPADQPGTHLV